MDFLSLDVHIDNSLASSQQKHLVPVCHLPGDVLDIVGRTYDIVTYDIQEYRRYDVAYDLVGVTYDVVVTDLRSRR